MKFKNLLGLGLALLAVASAAQLAVDPDWKESEAAPKPPAFRPDQLIPIDMPSYVSTRFGVDPSTLAITPDGIVRYVMVTKNATGSISAMYEGIRCARGEVKTYARLSASGHWSPVKDPQWQRLNDNLPSRHAQALAQQGVCEGNSITGNSAADIIRALKYPRPR